MGRRSKTSDQITSKGKEQVNREAEAARIAKEQVSSGMWNLQMVIFLYAVTITTVIMAFRGVRLEIIAASAIIGLSIVWIWGRSKYKTLYKRLYLNELHHLQELSNEGDSNNAGEATSPATKTTAVISPITSPLTPRQQEILNLIAAGNSNKQIATQLHLSERTIKNQIGRIFEKINVENRIQAVIVSVKNGWIQPELVRSHPSVSIKKSDKALYDAKIFSIPREESN